MKIKLKIAIIIAIMMIVMIGIILFTLKRLNMSKKYVEENEINQEEQNTQVNDTMVVTMINKEEQKQENNENKIEEKPILDPATLTQQIYNLNAQIGTLYIPKTGLTTAIYSNSNVDKMEKMPCFLYTTRRIK